MALFNTPTLTITDSTRPGWTATGRLLTSTPELFLGHKDWGTDLFVVEIPSGSWREAVTTTPIQLAKAGGSTFQVFSGLSAPVQNAQIMFIGPLQNPQLVDSRGSFVAFKATVEAGKFVRYDMSTGRAWLNSSETWTGGTEVSGYVDFGGPRGVFEITPKFISATNRVGELTFTHASYNTGSGVKVRGYPVHLY